MTAAFRRRMVASVVFGDLACAVRIVAVCRFSMNCAVIVVIIYVVAVVGFLFVWNFWRFYRNLKNKYL